MEQRRQAKSTLVKLAMSPQRNPIDPDAGMQSNKRLRSEQDINREIMREREAMEKAQQKTKRK